MGIATYEIPSCNDCLDTTVQPVFGTDTGESQTNCLTPCGTMPSAAIPLPLMPDGTPWKVDYFLQVLSAGDSPAPIDHYLNPVFQRLAWLKDMTIFVTQPLQSSIDPDTNVVVKTGEGTIVGIAPEPGDAFVAYLEFNNAYLFRVTDTETLTTSGAKTYKIQYSAHAIVANVPALLDDLAHKVADFDRYTFDISLYLKGQTPFTTTATQAATVIAATSLDSLLADWETFYDPDSACHVATVDGDRIYDPYVNDFMSVISPYRKSPKCRNNMAYLWQRTVSQYRTPCASLPYNAKGNFTPVKLYSRTESRVTLNLDQIKHTAIEKYVHDGTSMPADSGTSLSLLTGTVIHATGYITTPLYGTTNPAKTAIDSLIEAIHTPPMTPAIIANAITQYNTLPHSDKYWIIPLLIKALKG